MHRPTSYRVATFKPGSSPGMNTLPHGGASISIRTGRDPTWSDGGWRQAGADGRAGSSRAAGEGHSRVRPSLRPVCRPASRRSPGRNRRRWFAAPRPDTRRGRTVRPGDPQPRHRRARRRRASSRHGRERGHRRPRMRPSTRSGRCHPGRRRSATRNPGWRGLSSGSPASASRMRTSTGSHSLETGRPLNRRSRRMPASADPAPAST